MSSAFKLTGTILDRILAHKQEEIAARKKIVSKSEMRAQADNTTRPRNSLYAALRQRETIGLIAEVKHASPSKGVFVENFDPLEFATTYIENGVAAISVLTDKQFFRGHLEHLSAIGTETDFKVPLLRKDFIIDPYQIHETVAACADATLLIVAALEDIQLAELYSEMKMWSLEALVEVHNEAELERAMKINPRLIGVNNRDLKTFDVDLATTERITRLVPDSVLLVAESGIRNADDVRRMAQLGAHAVLVGETLVTSPNVAASVRELSNVRRIAT